MGADHGLLSILQLALRRGDLRLCAQEAASLRTLPPFSARDGPAPASTGHSRRGPALRFTHAHTHTQGSGRCRARVLSAHLGGGDLLASYYNNIII